MGKESNQTGPSAETPINLEAYAKEGRPIPQGRRYEIRIDKERYVVDTDTITGRQILALAHKRPEDYLLHQRRRGGQTKTIEADEKVDLTGEGPERFMTMKREAQEGLAPAQRQFRLPSADEQFLDENFGRWETISESGSQWIMVRDFELPQGFTAATSDMAIQLSAGYPDAALDMAYFYPPLQRSDAKGIPQVISQSIEGKMWQRWSRHRTGANPWIPGEDNIATHVAYVRSFLDDEFRKRP